MSDVAEFKSWFDAGILTATMMRQSLAAAWTRAKEWSARTGLPLVQGRS